MVMKIPFMVLFSLMLIVPTGVEISNGQNYQTEDNIPQDLTGAVSFNSPKNKIEKDDSQNFRIIDLDFNQLKQDPKKPPEIFVQLILRNANGELVAYVETNDYRGLRPLYLIDFTNELPDKSKKIIEKDGKLYWLFQFTNYEPPVKKDYSMAMYTLMDRIKGKATPLVWMNHDAYQVEPGDQLEVYWTIMREV